MKVHNKLLSLLSVFAICTELIGGGSCNGFHLSAYAMDANNSMISYLNGFDYIYSEYTDNMEDLQTNYCEYASCLESINYICKSCDSTQTISRANAILDLIPYSEPNCFNTDTVSKYLILDFFQEEEYIEYLLRNQNSDGSFGLDKSFAGDIIDTKLALKALTDIGETEAMTNAALYISSLQNEDGGFGYQQGLSSNAYLSAEIADILVDTVNVNPILSYYLEDTFTALDEYLDSVFPVISELSENDLDQVYQHFYTALYRLKRDGRYDVTPYYALQADDGGVFDDPMATALFLELLVREQNALVAKIDGIAITNDRGYAVSAFNSNENVNISVLNEYESEKAYLAVSIITPDGTVISLDGENSVWNTADNADGEYTVRAEIIRTSNDEVVTSLEQTFRIQHRLAVDRITLALSQPYSRVGDTDSVEIIAEFDISNFSEDNQLAINWTVTDVSGELIEEDMVNISEADVAMNSILLGSFIPDTSERNAYIIKAELMCNDMQIAQTTTNYFVSDKSVAITYDIDKEYLTEIDDNANVTINLRDERVVDLIFTTSSEDTELIEKYTKLVDDMYVESCNLSNTQLNFLDDIDRTLLDDLNTYFYIGTELFDLGMDMQQRLTFSTTIMDYAEEFEQYSDLLYIIRNECCDPYLYDAASKLIEELDNARNGMGKSIMDISKEMFSSPSTYFKIGDVVLAFFPLGQGIMGIRDAINSILNISEQSQNAVRTEAMATISNVIADNIRLNYRFSYVTSSFCCVDDDSIIEKIYRLNESRSFGEETYITLKESNPFWWTLITDMDNRAIEESYSVISYLSILQCEGYLKNEE